MGIIIGPNTGAPLGGRRCLNLVIYTEHVIIFSRMWLTMEIPGLTYVHYNVYTCILYNILCN